MQSFTFWVDIMVKLEDEERWGAMLGVVQTDMDKVRSVLRNVAHDALMGRETLETRLLADGKKPSDDVLYQRYFKLSSLLGGLYAMLQGVDGVMTSVIVELLKNEDV